MISRKRLGPAGSGRWFCTNDAAAGLSFLTHLKRSFKIKAPIQACPVYVFANVIESVPAQRPRTGRRTLVAADLEFGVAFFQADGLGRVRQATVFSVEVAFRGFVQPHFEAVHLVVPVRLDLLAWAEVQAGHLQGADHYVFLSHEPDVLRELRFFLAELGSHPTTAEVF